ncbi:MAG: hypothetical protein LBS42_07395 [Tannerella sp.]|jgi:hypothetical protein|nr:hypothetical protein [Tannerella sp.]
MSKEKHPLSDIFDFIEKYGYATVAENASAQEKLAFINEHFAETLHNYHTLVAFDALKIAIAHEKKFGISRYM